MIAAKKGSPLAIGIGHDDYFVASDASPIVEYTKNAVYLVMSRLPSLSVTKRLRIRNLKDQEVTPSGCRKLKRSLKRLKKEAMNISC